MAGEKEIYVMVGLFYDLFFARGLADGARVV
jgi:hypothetical protein